VGGTGLGLFGADGFLGAAFFAGGAAGAFLAGGFGAFFAAFFTAFLTAFFAAFFTGFTIAFFPGLEAGFFAAFFAAFFLVAIRFSSLEREPPNRSTYLIPNSRCCKAKEAFTI
jgi:hypothetical protein